VWITDEERRIEMNLDGSDHIVPLRLSDSFGGVRLRSNEQEQIWGGSPVEARVSSSPARSRPGVDLRRRSGGFCSTAMLGRGAEDHGESACKVGVEDGFQRDARKAAGGAPGVGRVG
jgi:hypothetical protein